MNLSEYRWMWIIAMFDLPVATKKERKAYARFRKELLEDGFRQMQFSVYTRHASSRENAEVHLKRIEAMVPESGEVRVIAVTDKQYGRMRIFWGKNRHPPERPPAQLELF
ncbi:MAG: CRISPR-associated endonuclease Cas2 [Phycisphaeraceae bacterium]|nr:CRISPR-associated endonuclease Cas2 [Phycisphaeraceae bacterium]